MKRDSQIFDLIAAERNRQMHGIELIASENFVSDQVMEAMGKAMHISEAGSTDCNVPVSLGVPAAVLGYGGTGGNCHNPEEWYRPDPNYPGPAHSLLMLLALTGLEGVCDGVIVKKK